MARRASSAVKIKAQTPRASRPLRSATQLSYDAISEKSRRRAPATTNYAEHVVLPEFKRKKLLATIHDQVRNASLVAWMIRRHLDYVSRFRFQFRTGNEALDKLVTRLFQWHAQPRNFDIAARFGREEMFRMFEMEKVVAGDAALVKLGDAKLQAIESDMIAYPTSGRKMRPDGYDRIPIEELSGVEKDTGAVMSELYSGRVDAWCICNRGWNGKAVAYDHLEEAVNVIFDGYFTRFSSQVRGVSPLSTAVNAIQDLYESFEYNLLKAKIHSLFGLAIMRDYAGADSDQEEVSGFGAASGITTGQTEQLTDASESSAGTKSVASSLQALNPDSMLMVDMETKGRIETIESKTPSSEFQNFSELMMRVVMLSFDIPYTAFNSASSNFAGMIADHNFYDVSCRWKREKNRWARQNYSDWLLAWAWDNADWGLQNVAIQAGVNRLRDLQESVEWIPAGAPWLQKMQEVQGDISTIAAGIDNPMDVCKRRGTDFFANVDKLAEAYAYAKSKGVPLMIGSPGQQTVESGDEDPDAPEPADDSEPEVKDEK